MSRPVLRCAVLLLCAFTLAACDFDGQEVIVVHDVENDRLDALIIYRGVYTDETGDNIAEDIEEMRRVRTRGKFAMWDSWPLVTDLTKPPKLTAALAKQVEVENGGLFRDEKGVLCGYQFVRVNKVKRFLRKLNAAVVVSGGGGDFAALANVLGFGFDERSLELLQAVRKGRHKAITMDGTSLRISLPLSANDHRRVVKALGDRMASELADELVKRLAREEDEQAKAAAKAELERQLAGGEPEDKPKVAATPDREEMLKRSLMGNGAWNFLFANDITLARAGDVTTLAIGLPGAERTHLKKPMAGGYIPGYEKHLVKDGWTVEDGVTDKVLMERFAGFRQRDPVLPPELAALRGK